MDVVEYKMQFGHLRTRPEGYGIPPGLVPAMVYLIACDASSDEQLFGRRFSEWIKVQRGEHSTDVHAWFREIVALALGKDREPQVRYWELDAAEAALTHQVLFDAVDAFLV